MKNYRYTCVKSLQRKTADKKVILVDFFDTLVFRRIHSYQVYMADYMDFSSLRYEYNEVFAVVPNLKALTDTCIRSYKAGTNYKEWWWKALRNDCCSMKNDNEITEYLNDYRFYRDNRVLAVEKRGVPLRESVGRKEYGYSIQIVVHVTKATL